VHLAVFWDVAGRGAWFRRAPDRAAGL
jgi:hypothetical protein